MRSGLALIVAIAGFLIFGAGPVAAAADPPLTPERRQEIEALVRDYLVKNPEIIVDAIDAMREKQRREKDERARAAVMTYRAALVEDPGTPVAGNPGGDVTIVEFFDYQCGYCKRVFPTLMKTVKEDGGVRLALKEFPILGPKSRYAAEAALASRKQGKYTAFHMALMALRGSLTEAAVEAVARSVGIDVAKLKDDMSDPAVRDQIEKNFALANALNIRGTPAFVIGDRLVPGAVNLETLKLLIAEARGKS